VTLVELVAALERRAAEADAMQASAPVSAVLRTVLAELGPLADGNGTPPASDTQAARWLTAGEVAALLHVSERWAYDHAAELGGRRLSRRCVRFSEAAVRRHLERRR
jgi:hypothetical protein